MTVVYRIKRPGMVQVEFLTPQAKYQIPGFFRNLPHARSHSDPKVLPLNILKT